MAGLNDRRRLGTDSGRMRREARAVARAGGNPSDLLNRAAITKLGEGSAISSSEENIAFDDYKKRMQSGLLETQRRATLGGDSRQSFDADLDRSTLVKTDPAARQRAYDRGATLGVSREDIDRRAGTLQGTAPVQTGTAPSTPSTTHPDGRPKITGQFKPGSALDIAEKELWTKPKPGASPLDQYENMPMTPEIEASIRRGTAPVQTGTAPQNSLTKTLPARPSGLTGSSPNVTTTSPARPSGLTGSSPNIVTPLSSGNPPPPSPLTSTPPPLFRAPMDSAAAADSRSLSRRKEMRAAEDAITGGGEPGNLAGLAARDAKDREAAITAARTESSGNDSVTRQSVIDRINKERVASGRKPFGEDIYADIGERGAAERGRTAKGKELSRVASGLAESAMTPLQKSLADAKNRFAPPPVEEAPLPVTPVPTDHVQSPQVSKGVPALLQPPVRGLAGRFGSSGNAKFFGPEGYVDPKHAANVAEMDAAKKAREEKNRAQMGTLFPRKRPMDNLFGSKASFLEGSLVGKAYDALNK